MCKTLVDPIWSGLEVELMVTKRDNDDDDRVNIEQSASGRLVGVLQFVAESSAAHYAAVLVAVRVQPSL